MAETYIAANCMFARCSVHEVRTGQLRKQRECKSKVTQQCAFSKINCICGSLHTGRFSYVFTMSKFDYNL